MRVSGEKCCICNQPFRKGQVGVRILVEAVTHHEDDEEGDGVDQWSETLDWSMIHQVHLECAARMTNSGRAFEYGLELNALPLDELVEETSIPRDIPPPLKLVQGGSR